MNEAQTKLLNLIIDSAKKKEKIFIFKSRRIGWSNLKKLLNEELKKINES